MQTRTTVISEPAAPHRTARAGRWPLALAPGQAGGRVFWRDALRRRMLAAADAAAALGGTFTLGLSGRPADVFWGALLVPLWILLAKLHGLYDRDHRALRHLTVDELSSISMWAATGTTITSLLLLASPARTPSLMSALWMWLTVFAAAFVFRASARWLWRRVTPLEDAAIIGEGPLADAMRRKLELFPDIHVRLVDSRQRITADDLSEDPAVLPHLDRLILASQSIGEGVISELVAFCRREKIKLSVVPPARAMFGTAVQLRHVAELPLVEYNTWDTSRSTLMLKRVLDLVVATLMLLFTPLFGLIALAIKLDSRGPVLFSQERAGLAGRTYRMLKFRTMVSNAEDLLADLVPLDRLEKPMFKLREDPRVTRVGRVLRRTSLDELPQLINVLKGEMSLVGPRPEQIDLVERYEPDALVKLAAKPGITGPMQVYGRGSLTFDERLAVEREYVDNISISRDLRILAMTIPAVVSGKGAF